MPLAPALRGTIFALSVDNHLLAVRADTGVITADRALAPAPAPSTPRFTGHYLALSREGRTLFALVPGDPGWSDHLAVVDVASARVQARYALPRGIAFRSLAVGPISGRLYLFGNQPGGRDTHFGIQAQGVVVTVVDPRRGAVLDRWTARPAGGLDWRVYQGLVSPNERTLFISYHGSDTTGIDWYRIGGRGLQQCRPTVHPSVAYLGVACIDTHGGFAVYGHGLLAATGDGFKGSIAVIDGAGRIRRTLDARLGGNHLMEFVVDAHAGKMYAVGSCGYTGGFSVIDIRTGRTRVLVPPAGPGQLPDPIDPNVKAPPICGERLALGPGALLVVGQTPVPVPQLGIPGALLFLHARTSHVLRSVPMPEEPVDVLATASS